MKKGALKFVFAVLILVPVCTKATIIKDFNENGTIATGDYYDQVNIWNTATVDMTGGRVTSTINTYNTSTLNISGGIIQGPPLTFIYLHDSGVLNLSGGLFYSTWIYPQESTVNIYGRDLAWIIDSNKRVHGYWADGTEFLITLARIENANIIFHEIPEPCTLGLFGFGFFILRRTIKTFHK